MNIGIVSMIHEPWGGSEELWGDMAAIALDNGDKVIHSALVNGAQHSKIKKLISRGLIHLVRAQYVPDNKPLVIRAFFKRLYFLKELLVNPFSHLVKYNLDTIAYIGTSYSIEKDFGLIEVCKKSNIKLFIHANLNTEHLVNLSTAQKQKIITAYNYAEKIYFVSERNMQVAFKELGRSFENAAVIRNPVNINSTDILPFPKNDVPQMAMVGNLLCIHKGQDIAIKLLSSEKWKDKEWQLNIYGSGPDEKLLKDLVHAKGMEQKIIFHGKVADIRELWKENHILLMPSHMEGMPLAVVEAMLCGRPVVATDVGGHKEWIADAEQGYIAAKPTETAFDTALTAAWHNMPNWEAMGKSAHEKALKQTDLHAGQTFYIILKAAVEEKI